MHRATTLFRKLTVRIPLLATLALPALVAGLARTATAAPIPGVGATLTIEIAGLPTVSLSGSGTVDVASDGSISLPAGLLSATNVVAPITSTTAIFSITASILSNQSGAFAPLGASAVSGEICAGTPATGEACVAGGGLGGPMGLNGVLNVHVVENVVVLPIDLDVLQVGQGGSGNTPFIVDAAPWTTGVALVNEGPGTISELIAITGSHAGTRLTLVTTTFVSACGNILPVLGTLELTGIPEPGMLALLGAGAIGLVAVAATRRRR